MKASIYCVSLFFLFLNAAFADRLLLSDDRTITGTVLQTNDGNILLLTDYGTRKYSESVVKKISIDRQSSRVASKADRIPDSRNLILQFSKQTWASKLKQIPATVVDKGMLRNVPYISFKCGDDYEINIYGDLDHPAGIEAGVYRSLLEDSTAKSNCISFISSLLGKTTDKAIVQGLEMEKDLKTFDGLTFEITPPTAEDSYNGWWISVYSEANLNFARASDEEIKQITTTKTVSTQDKNPNEWSTDELKDARSTSLYPSTITFTDKSGNLHSDVQVIRVIDGSSLIWRDGASGGLIKLADLPEKQRNKFGYDPAKAAAVEKSDQQKQAQLAAAALALQQNASAGGTQSISSSDVGDSFYPSSSGRVFVHGYTKSNGTYVQSYTRRR